MTQIEVITETPVGIPAPAAGNAIFVVDTDGTPKVITTNGIFTLKGASGAIPTADVVLTALALAAGAVATGAVALGKGYRISKIVANRGCWVRLYTTAAKRTADAARLRTADPAGDHGVIAEAFMTAGVLSLETLPQPHGSVALGNTYYSIVNDGDTGDTTVTLTYQTLES